MNLKAEDLKFNLIFIELVAHRQQWHRSPCALSLLCVTSGLEAELKGGRAGLLMTLLWKGAEMSGIEEGC